MLKMSAKRYLAAIVSAVAIAAAFSFGATQARVRSSAWQGAYATRRACTIMQGLMISRPRGQAAAA